MVTRHTLLLLRRLNAYLPERLYWSYHDTEIIEISCDIEASIELTNGRVIYAEDVEIEKVMLLSDTPT